MRNLPLMLGIAFALARAVLMNSMFIVRQDRQAIVLRFGQYTSVNQRAWHGSNRASISRLPFFDTVGDFRPP